MYMVLAASVPIHQPREGASRNRDLQKHLNVTFFVSLHQVAFCVLCVQAVDSHSSLAIYNFSRRLCSFLSFALAWRRGRDLPLGLR